MAASVPTSLKTPEIVRFAQRAAQLEQARPVIAYWCQFWILTQILEKNLHNTDQDALTYTTSLMDHVEQFKSNHSTDDTVTDDVAGKAYVEQFGLETFNRADNAVRADKASKQTADTFQAAATFFELLAIWGDIEQEVQAKIKYAKYHALRIVKAIKAGEDPNASNPKQAVVPEDVLPELDPNDAEVQALAGTTTKTSRQPSVIDVPDEAHRLQAGLARTSRLDQSLHPSRDPSAVRQQRQPSVTDVPDQAFSDQSRLARQSSTGESLHPSRTPSVKPDTAAVSPIAPTDAAAFYTGQTQSDISPIDPPAMPERKPSIGGNYFPVTSPSDVAQPQTSGLPSVPDDSTLGPSFTLPTVPSEPSLPSAPTTFATIPPANTHPNPDGHFIPPPPPGQNLNIPPNLAPTSQPQHQRPQAPPQLRGQSLGPSISSPAPPPPPPPTTAYGAQHQTQPVPLVSPLPVPSVPSMYQPAYTTAPAAATTNANVVVDEEAILKAQKHARWAISALNFEDVPTAIRELQGALSVLGARQ